jgi:hypothetical protein
MQNPVQGQPLGPAPLFLYVKTKHILRTSVGVTCEMTFDEDTAQFEYAFSPCPVPKKKRAVVVKEYLSWRDNIFADWSARTGRVVTIVTV